MVDQIPDSIYGKLPAEFFTELMEVILHSTGCYQTTREAATFY